MQYHGKNTLITIFRSGLLILSITLSFSFAIAADSGRSMIEIVKLSAQDGRAVIRRQDGKMLVIKAGDTISDDRLGDSNSELYVKEIAEGRVVFEEKKGTQTETIIVMFENGKQRVEKIKKVPEKQPHSYAPRIVKQHGQEDNAPLKK